MSDSKHGLTLQLIRHSLMGALGGLLLAVWTALGLQAEGITVGHGIIPRITVEIHPTRQPNRILRQEPSRLRIIPAVAQIDEPAARVRRRGAGKAGLSIH